MKKLRDLDDIEAFWFGTAIGLLIVLTLLVLICLD